MGHKNRIRVVAIAWIGGLFMLSGQQMVSAQEAATTNSAAVISVDAGSVDAPDGLVTLTVKNASISEVLKVFSLQTGQSIVVGPDVVSDNVNVRLVNIPWRDALDVILPPYGFGYRVVGDAIIINKTENLVSAEGIEPLVSKVFTLRFVDAYDIQDICAAQLTGRGKCSILSTRSMPGWEFGGDSDSGAAVEGGVRQKREREDIQKSKKLVITDIRSALTKVEQIIAEVDVMPRQVLIEAKFLEISSGDLADIGLDYIGGLENIEELSQSTSDSMSLVDDDLLNVLNLTAGFPNPLNTGATASFSQDSGIRLSHSILDDWGAELLFAFMENNEKVNILSAPSILSIDNQEAAILVGQKYPIIESQNNSGSGSTVTSTSLDYYENVGIQLNVIPQVCAEGYVNMIVHPAVSEIDSFESGVVTAGSDTQSGTQYPVLDIREAETQIMIQSAKTAIIGGLQSDRERKAVKKVPLLGDLPLIGRLFRRETSTTEQVDLLIFIKATIVDNDPYQAESDKMLRNREYMMEHSDDPIGTSREESEMDWILGQMSQQSK